MIRYVIGDATHPVGDGLKVIAHLCNDVGAWGAGFVLAVSRRWPEPEAVYRDEARMGRLRLGAVQFVTVERDLVVANLIAQHGFPAQVRRDAVAYDALDVAFVDLFARAAFMGASVHMPRIGCGIAGGRWDRIAPLIEDCAGRVSVTVYDLPPRTA